MSDKLRDVREAARAAYEERAERVGELVREGHLSVVEGAEELSAGQRKLEAASAGARGMKERTSVLEGIHICVICNDIVTQATHVCACTSLPLLPHMLQLAASHAHSCL